MKFTVEFKDRLRFLGRVMTLKLYTDHSCLSLQVFEKRSDFYVCCSLFNVSIYAPCHDCVVSRGLIDLPGKRASQAQTAKKEVERL